MFMAFVPLLGEVAYKALKAVGVLVHPEMFGTACNEFVWTSHKCSVI
jgi:hypothetical protein